MGDMWFGSDWHILHERQAERRGFASVAEHDEFLVKMWNKRVRPGDFAWVLGDVGVGDEDAILATVQRMNGHIHLITGNHDAPWPGNRRSYHHQRRWLEVFESVQAFARIRIRGELVLMSHFPYEGDHTEVDRGTQYRLRDAGEWLLHGHIHTTDRRTGARTIHVGADAWNMSPVSLMEVGNLMQSPWEPPAPGAVVEPVSVW